MDKLTNFLAIIKAGARSRRRSILVPYTRFNCQILDFFRDRGYISIWKFQSDRRLIEVFFRYSETNVSPLSKIKIVSKPGLRRYLNHRQITQRYRMDPFVLFSTVNGLKFSGEILTFKTSDEGKLGGEILFRLAN